MVILDDAGTVPIKSLHIPIQMYDKDGHHHAGNIRLNSDMARTCCVVHVAIISCVPHTVCLGCGVGWQQ